MLGERTAEEIKMALGSAFPVADEPHAEIRGRDLVSGLPKTVVISAAEVRRAIEEPVNLIIDAVKTTLDKCPPELAGDVMDRGIALTGGGALLRGPRPADPRGDRDAGAGRGQPARLRGARHRQVRGGLRDPASGAGARPPPLSRRQAERGMVDSRAGGKGPCA